MNSERLGVAQVGGEMVTDHAWHNRSDKPVVLGIVMLGAKRRA